MKSETLEIPKPMPPEGYKPVRRRAKSSKKSKNKEEKKKKTADLDKIKKELAKLKEKDSQVKNNPSKESKLKEKKDLNDNKNEKTLETKKRFFSNTLSIFGKEKTKKSKPSKKSEKEKEENNSKSKVSLKKETIEKKENPEMPITFDENKPLHEQIQLPPELEDLHNKKNSKEAKKNNVEKKQDKGFFSIFNKQKSGRKKTVDSKKQDKKSTNLKSKEFEDFLKKNEEHEILGNELKKIKKPTKNLDNVPIKTLKHKNIEAPKPKRKDEKINDDENLGYLKKIKARLDEKKYGKKEDYTSQRIEEIKQNIESQKKEIKGNSKNSEKINSKFENEKDKDARKQDLKEKSIEEDTSFFSKLFGNKKKEQSFESKNEDIIKEKNSEKKQSKDDKEQVSDDKLQYKQDLLRKRENLLIMKREELKNKAEDLKRLENEVNNKFEDISKLQEDISAKEEALELKGKEIENREEKLEEIEKYLEDVQQRRVNAEKEYEKTSKLIEEERKFQNYIKEKIVSNQIPSIDSEFDNFAENLEKIYLYNLIDQGYINLRRGNLEDARKNYTIIREKFNKIKLDYGEKLELYKSIMNLFSDIKNYSEGLVERK